MLEGGDRELTLVADKRFEVSFTVDVALEDITAIGKCSVQAILHVPHMHCTVIQWRLLTHSGKECAGVCEYVHLCR